MEIYFRTLDIEQTYDRGKNVIIHRVLLKFLTRIIVKNCGLGIRITKYRTEFFAMVSRVFCSEKPNRNLLHSMVMPLIS